MMRNNSVQFCICICIILLFGFCPVCIADSSPPINPVKLIFIHHSVGENWLADDNGQLGKSLGENNYFVSDTYYGWGPDAIGDRTDIVNWPEWFTGPESDRIMSSLYQESDEDAAGWDYYNRPMADPGGENEIILFKSCYPNSDLGGDPDDPPGDYPDMTVSGAKYVYNEILEYFARHPEKLFIAITPPPEISSEYAEQAESFSTWLTTEWLDGYSGNNVGVFDLHAVLSSPRNHHTIEGDEILYITGHGNTLAYPTEDPHPSATGNLKATREFLPLLNYYYNRWISGERSNTAPVVSQPVMIDITPGETISPEDTLSPEEMIIEETEIPEEIEPAVTREETGSFSWVTYDDGVSDITLTEGEDNSAFCIETEVEQGGWTSVESLFDTSHDWSAYNGLSYLVTSELPGLPYTLAIYSGGQGEYTGYYTTKITGSIPNEAERQSVLWSDLMALDGTEQFDPKLVYGIFYSFDEEKSDPGYFCISQIEFI